MSILILPNKLNHAAGCRGEERESAEGAGREVRGGGGGGAEES